VRLLYEAIPPVNPVTVLAVAALFTLCALVVAIGIVKLVDAIARAFFGTISGAVAWIPFAGSVVSHSLHKVEQKISHMLGSAERKLDAGVAMTWNNCAHLVAYIGTEIEGGARTAWALAQQAKAFVTHRVVSTTVRATVAPVKAATHTVEHGLANVRAEGRAVAHSVAQGVYPRLRAAENEITHVLEPDIAALRARTKALERGAIRTFDWIRAHPGTLAATAFAGAVAVALTKLGGGWIRCKNWRAIGKRVCGIPWSTIEALLAIGLATELVIDPEKVAEAALLAVDALEPVIEKIAD